MRVTVVGATGQFGALVSERLEESGGAVVRAHRGSGVNAVTGEGLADACAGSDVIVDVTNFASRSGAKSRRFFGSVARNVSLVASQTGAHVVYLTIVGAAEPDVHAKMGHYQGKAEQESVYAAELGAGATAVASVQWYSLAETFLSMMKVGPVAMLPHMLSKPAAAEDVAAEFARVVLDPNRPQRFTVAGPDVIDMADVGRRIAAVDGKPKRIRAINFGGPAMRSGKLIPDRPDAVTAITLDQWLDARTRGR
ncbi:SDR family oxidoreductase [Gordonia zhaorongruii]|uniref:SDR family oxidoreductase n=1 Tax=Gordonia zhaorongruii TaxID=2597659 RepID=UPI001404459D|nr:SDR family oxidoreductase [Gordonia zhaorongruii]